MENYIWIIWHYHDRSRASEMIEPQDIRKIPQPHVIRCLLYQRKHETTRIRAKVQTVPRGAAVRGLNVKGHSEPHCLQNEVVLSDGGNGVRMYQILFQRNSRYSHANMYMSGAHLIHVSFLFQDTQFGNKRKRFTVSTHKP